MLKTKGEEKFECWMGGEEESGYSVHEWDLEGCCDLVRTTRYFVPYTFYQVRYFCEQKAYWTKFWWNKGRNWSRGCEYNMLTGVQVKYRYHAGQK